MTVPLSISVPENPILYTMSFCWPSEAGIFMASFVIKVWIKTFPTEQIYDQLVIIYMFLTLRKSKDLFALAFINFKKSQTYSENPLLLSWRIESWEQTYRENNLYKSSSCRDPWHVPCEWIEVISNSEEKSYLQVYLIYIALCTSLWEGGCFHLGNLILQKSVP